ncbi:MAG: hypothetical protein MUO68_09540 [Desulfobacteraceae bacterium]|nr:hypothetical protein [Desulfobacteraceae bacterium]
MNAMRPIHPGEVLKEELSEISMTDRQCLCPGIACTGQPDNHSAVSY